MTDSEQICDVVESSERRDFLAAVGATATVPLTSGVAGATSSEEQTSVTVSVRRSRSNPLSLKRANALTRRAVEQYRNKSGSQDRIGYTQTVSSEDLDVYALTVHINEEGYPVSYLGVGSSTTSRGRVQEMHSKADEFEASAKENIASVTQIGGDGDNVSSAAPSGLSPDWKLAGTSVLDPEFGEYGGLRTATDVGTYKVEPEAGEDRYHFGTFTEHINTPGYAVSDSPYRQSIGRVTHDYSDYQGEMSVGSHEPSGDASGSIDFEDSISLGITGPTLSIAASHKAKKIERNDLSNSREDRFSWQWVFNHNPLWDGPTTRENIFETSSLALTRDKPSYREQIMSVNSIGEWVDPFTGATSGEKSIEQLFYYNI